MLPFSDTVMDESSSPPMELIMSVQEGLNIATLAMCFVTFVMASAALMPQIKQAAVLVRDGLLWASLLGILGFVAIVGWGRLHEAQQREAEYEAVEEEYDIVPRRRVVAEPAVLTGNYITPNRSDGAMIRYQSRAEEYAPSYHPR